MDLRSLLSEVDGFIEIFQDFIGPGDPVEVLKLVGLQLQGVRVEFDCLLGMKAVFAEYKGVAKV